MRHIDLRSDTVTHPTPAMRRAMAEAELGDDVFGDDPTVNALEDRAASLLGKEAGLFVTSGTQGNLVSLMAHLGRGQEAVAAYESHIVMDEAAGHAVVVGASVRALRSGPDGTMDPDELDESFRDPGDPHEPISGLVAIENTHAHSMGQPLGVAYTQAVADVAHAHGEHLLGQIGMTGHRHRPRPQAQREEVAQLLLQAAEQAYGIVAEGARMAGQPVAG